MKYSDLRIGMPFNIFSEDNIQEFSEGDISKIYTINGNIAVQFNDTLDTFTMGKPSEVLPNCLYYKGVYHENIGL